MTTTTATTPAPIYAQLRERAAAKQAAHDRKILKEAMREIAAYMDELGFAELNKYEIPSESLNQAWTRIWDGLNRDRTLGTVEFKIKGVIYWLSRDFI